MLNGTNAEKVTPSDYNMMSNFVDIKPACGGVSKSEKNG